MNTTTIAVDLAKIVFQAHVANGAGHVRTGSPSWAWWVAGVTVGRRRPKKLR